MVVVLDMGAGNPYDSSASSSVGKKAGAALPDASVWLSTASTWSKSSSSSSSLSACCIDARDGNGSTVCDVSSVLGRLSFTGEGETGSPRKRLRARETGFDAFELPLDLVLGGGRYSGSGSGSRAWKESAGSGAGEASRRGLDFALPGVANGLGSLCEGDGDGDPRTRRFDLSFLGENGFDADAVSTG